MNERGLSYLEMMLDEGLDDWIYPSWITGAVLDGASSSPRELRTLALGIVAEAIFAELAIPGDVTSDGFKQWPLAMAQSFERIANEWIATEPTSVRPGDIFWLQNTAKGDAVARQAKARAGASKP